ncbi:MAG: hypothetical protein WDO06_07670 [Actinomycetota bacterium]
MLDVIPEILDRLGTKNNLVALDSRNIFLASLWKNARNSTEKEFISRFFMGLATTDPELIVRLVYIREMRLLPFTLAAARLKRSVGFAVTCLAAVALTLLSLMALQGIASSRTSALIKYSLDSLSPGDRTLTVSTGRLISSQTEFKEIQSFPQSSHFRNRFEKAGFTNSLSRTCRSSRWRGPFIWEAPKTSPKTSL